MGLKLYWDWKQDKNTSEFFGSWVIHHHCLSFVSEDDFLWTMFPISICFCWRIASYQQESFYLSGFSSLCPWIIYYVGYCIDLMYDICSLSCVTSMLLGWVIDINVQFCHQNSEKIRKQAIMKFTLLMSLLTIGVVLSLLGQIKIIQSPKSRNAN